MGGRDPARHYRRRPGAAAAPLTLATLFPQVANAGLPSTVAGFGLLLGLLTSLAMVAGTPSRLGATPFPNAA
jgi:hypothetical protein